MGGCRVVIAVDFGTHASGFAYALAEDRGKSASEQLVAPWRDWPQALAYRYFKTRTAVLRSSSDESLARGNEACTQYWQAERQGTAAALQLRQGFKLKLVSRDEPDEDARRGAIADAVDYLGWLREKAVEVVQRRYPRLSEDEICWCVTMPLPAHDGQDDYAAVLRAEVLGPAGFPAAEGERLLLLAEPEAAAVYCGAMLSAPGERFVVVDAGGGTVDITALEVQASQRLRQIGFQAGGKLGSRVLDDRFENIVNERLGQVSGWQEEASPVLADWARIMDTWEVDKRTWQFTEEFYRIELPWRTLRRAGSFPAAGNGGIDNGQLLVASESIVSGVFEPLVSDILEKLDKVLASLVHGPGPGQVILVGGFGGCFYLRDRLQRHLADRAPGVPLTILDDDLPGEAIVRGAAHFALTPDVISSRTMQHTYGCEMAADCRRPGDRHPELHERVRATRWSGEREACRQVRKLATRGQVIEPGTLSDVITLLPADFRQRTVVFTLYRSDEPDPYFTDRCQVVGSAELGVRSPWWRTGRQRRAEVQVTFGGSELLVQRVDRRSHEEIRLSYSREAPHDRA